MKLNALIRGVLCSPDEPLWPVTVLPRHCSSGTKKSETGSVLDTSRIIVMIAKVNLILADPCQVQ